MSNKVIPRCCKVIHTLCIMLWITSRRPARRPVGQNLAMSGRRELSTPCGRTYPQGASYPQAVDNFVHRVIHRGFPQSFFSRNLCTKIFARCLEIRSAAESFTLSTSSSGRRGGNASVYDLKALGAIGNASRPPRHPRRGRAEVGRPGGWPPVAMDPSNLSNWSCSWLAAVR